jgi:hypothetical protein
MVFWLQVAGRKIRVSVFATRIYSPKATRDRSEAGGTQNVEAGRTSLKKRSRKGALKLTKKTGSR